MFKKRFSSSSKIHTRSLSTKKQSVVEHHFASSTKNELGEMPLLVISCSKEWMFATAIKFEVGN